MGFWETAAAVFVGGLGLLVLTGLCRFAWLMFKANYTAFGRVQPKVGMEVEEALRHVERRET